MTRYTSEGRIKMSPGDLDRRNRITVFLVADGRARYFNFYCMYCGQKVCEIQGTLIYQVRDVDDLSRHSEGAKLNVRCIGRNCDAHVFYEFTLG